MEFKKPNNGEPKWDIMVSLKIPLKSKFKLIFKDLHIGKSLLKRLKIKL
jgi:hypothetical protein